MTKWVNQLGLLGYKVIWSGHGFCGSCRKERDEWVYFGAESLCTLCWRLGKERAKKILSNAEISGINKLSRHLEQGNYKKALEMANRLLSIRGVDEDIKNLVTKFKTILEGIIARNQTEIKHQDPPTTPDPAYKNTMPNPIARLFAYITGARTR